MSQEIDVDADPFLKLLTDALRAGPGSPEWHQAVTRLRESNGSGVGGESDDYRLLIAAREHLESGREYRSVRAGPGFTRKLMQGIEQGGDGGRRRGLPTATLIALASALAIGAAVVVVALRTWPRAPAEPARATVDDLVRVRPELMNPAAFARFDAPGAGFPDGWRRIGGLPLDPSRGLRPAAGPADAPATAPAGGGLIAPGPIGPDEPFAAEVLLRPGRPTEDTLFEFFVSTDPTFSADRATSSSDLVWLLQGSRQKVLLSGREQSNGPRPEPPGGARDGGAATAGDSTPVPVRILVNRDSALVECNGQRQWAGPHGLPAAPRYVGVRFLRTGPRPHDPASVLEVRVMKK